MNVKTYIPIENPIEAICWNGKNLDEIKEFLGDKLTVEDSVFSVAWGNIPCMYDLFIIQPNDKKEKIYLDYYIIKAGNTYTTMDPLTFSLTYKEKENATE